MPLSAIIAIAVVPIVITISRLCSASEIVSGCHVDEEVEHVGLFGRVNHVALGEGSSTGGVEVGARREIRYKD